MAFRSLTRSVTVLVFALIIAALLAPSSAFGDTLSWDQRFYGPRDIPNTSPEKDDYPVAARLNGVSFFDATHGWAVGTWTDSPGKYGYPKYGLAAYTRDGGSTWSTYTPPGVELLAVATPSANRALGTTALGTISRWNGSSWSSITISGWPTSGSRALRGIAFTDSQHGWAVGDRGGVAKTTDGGVTWRTVSAPTTGRPTLRAIARVDSSKCIAVGDSGSVKVIRGTGVSTVSSRTTKGLRGVTFADSKRGWAVGDGAIILRTNDGGATWTARLAPLPANVEAAYVSITAVDFADNLNGMAVGAYQQVWRTSDGGVTWSHSRVPGLAGDGELRGIGFVPGDALHPVTVGGAYQGQLTQSTDKARAYCGTWTGRVPPAPAAVSLVDPGAPGPRVRVSWGDASSNEHGYAIERSRGSVSGPWTQAATTTANTVSWTDEGVDWGSTWFYRVRGFSDGGTSAWTYSGGLKVDALAPATTVDARFVYLSSATLNFVQIDSESGVASTEWMLDSVPGVGVSVQTSEVGTHTLLFRSLDNAGNAEDWKSVSFYVSGTTVADDVAPVTTIVAPSSYHAAPARISLVATDLGGAGLFGTYVRIDGRAAVSTSSILLSTAGIHRVEYFSIDYAGNVESSNLATVTVIARPSSTGQPSRPVTPATVARSKYFPTYGYVRRYSKTYQLKLYFYRYESGRWVYKLSDTTSQSRVSVPGDDFNEYRASTRLTTTGKWRVRAKHVVGSRTIYSPYHEFTVK